VLANIDLSEMEQRGDALLEKQKAMPRGGAEIPSVTAAGAANRVPAASGNPRDRKPLWRQHRLFRLNLSFLAEKTGRRVADG